MATRSESINHCYVIDTMLLRGLGRKLEFPEALLPSNLKLSPSCPTHPSERDLHLSIYVCSNFASLLHFHMHLHTEISSKSVQIFSSLVLVTLLLPLEHWRYQLGQARYKSHHFWSIHNREGCICTPQPAVRWATFLLMFGQKPPTRPSSPDARVST